MSNEKVSIKISKKSGFTHILFALAAQGFTHLVVKYSGSGDDGAIDSVNLYKAGYITETENDGDIHMSILAESDIECEDTLEDCIKDHVCSAVLDHVGDWSNNDGGQGELIISTANGDYHCDHSYNHMEKTDTPSWGKIGD